MSTALTIVGCIFVAIILFFGWALCAAAKRGDEPMEDDLAQFSHRWERRT